MAVDKLARREYHDEQEEQEPKSCWSNLPLDLLISILYHLSPRDRSAFNATCRSWNATILPLAPPIDSLYLDYPCFFSQNSNSTCKFYYPIHNKLMDNIDMPDLEGAIIRSSNFGWLLMSRFDLSLFFFNPFTKQKIELPPSGTAFRAMCFTSPPTSPDCIVFGLSTFCETYVDIGTIERGKTDWNLKEFKNKTRFRPSTLTPVFHKGSFYCIDLAGKVGIFYPNNSENKWTVLTWLTKRRREKVIRQNFLVQVDGELLAVLNHDDRKIMVERLDRTNRQWKPVQDLGKILYVSHGASFAEDARMKNMVVYFPKFRDNIGVLYSTNTGKYHSVVGNFSSKTSYDLDEIIEFGTWVKPNLDIALEEQLTW